MQKNRRYNYVQIRSRPILSKSVSENSWRMHLVQISLYLIGSFIILRLFQVQIVDRDIYVAQAHEQYLHQQILKAKRGLIYDRNGRPLALNKPTYDVGLDLSFDVYQLEVAKKLSNILKESEHQILNRIRKGKNFVMLARKLDVETSKRIDSLNIPGLRIIETSERIYPLNEKLAQVIGFDDVDGNGISGIELAFDKYLRGRDGWSLIQKDATGKNLMPIESATKEPKKGDDVTLTIDYVLQTIAEEELSNAISRYQAKGGSIIITNPNTGEILAMSSVPGFNANHAHQFKPERWRIRSITDIFEPGSTFKIVTMMAALSSGVKKTNDIIFCENGNFKYYGKTINDPKKYGWLSCKNVLIYSSNIGTVKIAQELGKDKLYKAARDFGFGIKTGIGLSGEVSGILKKPTYWSEFSLAAISIGHEVAVTPLQMAMAYGAIANGGLLMKPSIVKQIRSEEGKIIQNFKPQVIRRVMKREIANTLAAILEETVEKGTGQLAKISGYKIAGKTGTAQKPRQGEPGYSDSKFVASFAGFFPSNHPKILIFLMIDEPYPTHSGGQVAAPTFRNTLQRILKIYNTPPVRHVNKFSSTNEIANRISVPDLVGRRLESAIKILKELNIKYQLQGEGTFVKKQDLRAGLEVEEKREIILTLSNYSDKTKYTTVPKLIGLPLRTAVAELSLRGLKVLIVGSGRVVKQEPQAGSKIKKGARCFLECAPVTKIKLIDNNESF